MKTTTTATSGIATTEYLLCAKHFTAYSEHVNSFILLLLSLPFYRWGKKTWKYKLLVQGYRTNKS